MRLNLGCGSKVRNGWRNVDRVDGEGVDEVADLDVFPWPWDDGSVIEVLAEHIWEHLRFPVRALHELHRVASPGAVCTIEVPHARGPDALIPGHRSFWDEDSLEQWTTESVSTSYEAGALFLVRSCRVKHVHPFAWHQRRYLGREVLGWGPLSIRWELVRLRDEEGLR